MLDMQVEPRFPGVVGGPIGAAAIFGVKQIQWQFESQE